MGLRPVHGDGVLPSAARSAGTYTSGQLANAGQATDVLLTVHCTAASGTGPTLDASLEESADGVTWTAIPGSGITQLTAVGNRVAAAAVTKSLVRVTSTVAGTAASVTYRVALLTVLAGLAEGEEPAGGAHSLLPAETGEGFFHVQTHIALRAGAFTCPPSRVTV